MTKSIVATAALAAVLSVNAFGQASFNALNDFSLKSNPNGAWSYLLNNSLMTMPISNSGGTEWQGAIVDGYGEAIGKNISGAPLNAGPWIFPTDHLYLSTAQGNVAVRFTAPSSGSYTVAGDFLGIEIAQVSHIVKILVNGTQTISGTIGSYNQSFPFNFVETFRAGDTVDFVNVGPSAVSLGYMTALTATITPVAVPAISPNGVVSAGAFGGFTSVAPGTWIEIYGSNLATNTRSWAGSDFVGTTAPTKLDGTTVTIGGQSAFVDYISPTQVNALVPSNVGAGPQQVTVSSPTGISTPFIVTVNATQPGLLAPSSFILNKIPYVVALFTDGTYVLPVGAIAGINSRPARPGDVIVLYGVGFGPVTPNIAAGQVVGQANSVASGLQISIGGQVAAMPYDGLAFNYTGLYQFNITVPQVAPGNLPLTFILGGVAGTQTLNIAIGQ